MFEHKQRGMALLFTLIILLIVAMISISASRSSLFSERMAFNSQADDLTFQAAETSINSVIMNARLAEQNGSGSAFLTRLISGQTIISCVSLEGGFKESACQDSASNTIDTRSSLLAQSSSTFELETNAENFDPGEVVDLEFRSNGEGKFLSAMGMPYANENVQHWRKLGPPSGYFHDSKDLMNFQ